MVQRNTTLKAAHLCLNFPQAEFEIVFGQGQGINRTVHLAEEAEEYGHAAEPLSPLSAETPHSDDEQHQSVYQGVSAPQYREKIQKTPQ